MASPRCPQCNGATGLYVGKACVVCEDCGYRASGYEAEKGTYMWYKRQTGLIRLKQGYYALFARRTLWDGLLCLVLGHDWAPMRDGKQYCRRCGRVRCT